MTADPSDDAAALGAIKAMVLSRTGALGWRMVTGSGMAKYQSLDAFRLVTGLRPDAARMQRQIVAMVG